MNAVASSGALFFAMLGDMGYADTTSATQNYALYAAQFRDFLAHPDVAPVLAHMPLFGMQDDHDYGLDDASRLTVKSYAAEAFADLIPGTQYPAATYRSWSIGQADFWLLDNRRYRDPKLGPYENGKWPSVLGSVQRTWLLDGLRTSAARVKVILAPMTFTWYWRRAERDVLLNHVATNVSGTVIICSGDMHSGALRGLVRTCASWELLACPIYNRKKGATTAKEGVLWTENGTGVALYNVVGFVDIDTLSASPTCVLRLLHESGAELHREVISL